MGRPPPWLDRCEKSQQVIAVTGVRSVFPVCIFLADQTCFFKVLDGSPDGFLRNTEILGDLFYAGPSLLSGIPAIIKIDVDELCPVRKLVVSVQLFKIRQLYHLLYRCAYRCASLPLLVPHSFTALGFAGAAGRRRVRERTVNGGQDGFFRLSKTSESGIRPLENKPGIPKNSISWYISASCFMV